MKWISLSKGWYCCLDAEDFENISKFVWHADPNGYAVRTEKTIKMHREFFNNLPDDIVIDHINRAKWDNRKINLRACSISVNNANLGMPDNPPFPTEIEKLNADEQRKELKITIQRNNALRAVQDRKNLGNFVPVRNKKTGEVFKSMAEAARKLNISLSNISRCCKGFRLSCGGIEWEYLSKCE